jgi:hypothetical protein
VAPRNDREDRERRDTVNLLASVMGTLLLVATALVFTVA